MLFWLVVLVVPDMPRNVTVLETSPRSIRLSADIDVAALQLDDVVIRPTDDDVISSLEVTSWLVKVHHVVLGRASTAVKSLKFDRGNSRPVTSERL